MSEFVTDEILNDEIGRHVVALKIPALKTFAMHSLKLFGDTNKLNEANQVIDVLLAMLKKKKQINEQNAATWIDVIIVAALLHNLFYDGTFSSVFRARESLTSVANNCEVPDNARYAIFQAIECQLGDDMPIDACRPIPSTPNELFAWACWFVEELHGNKEMPNL